MDWYMGLLGVNICKLDVIVRFIKFGSTWVQMFAIWTNLEPLFWNPLIMDLGAVINRDCTSPRLSFANVVASHTALRTQFFPSNRKIKHNRWRLFVARTNRKALRVWDCLWGRRAALLGPETSLGLLHLRLKIENCNLKGGTMTIPALIPWEISGCHI